MKPPAPNDEGPGAEIEDMLNCIEDPAVALSTDFRILAANRPYRDRYDSDRSPVGRFCYEVSHGYDVPCDHAGESCPLAQSLATGRNQRVLHLHQTALGEEHVDVVTHPIGDGGGSTKYVIEIMRESSAASSRASPKGMVGRSRTFNQVIELIHRVAPTNSAVLLEGESGVGKELVARAVHDHSLYAKKPFVVVECSGLTESLFESELFGHERGSFTGAHSRKIGLIEACEGGTLFLDEVGDIPLSLQVKLLRLLETGTYRRVGSVEPRKATFRLITATNQNLERMVEENRFRRDLFYRLSIFPIHLPALRERLEDLPLLAESLLKRVAPGRRLALGPDALNCLRRYPFPGNIRELRNVLERASLLADDDVILPQHLPAACKSATTCGSASGPDDDGILTLAEAESRYLADVVSRYEGDKESLARELGVSKRTLFRKLHELKQRNETTGLPAPETGAEGGSEDQGTRFSRKRF